jgi:hypothetical protein
MKEQMIKLINEEAARAGLSVTCELARKLLDVVEDTLNDEDRRTALRRLSEVIDEAMRAQSVGGDNAAH